MKKGIVSLAVIAMAASTVSLSQSGAFNAAKTLGATTSGANRYYYSDYASKEEALEAGLKVNEQIAEEGMVLVKNENDCLPLKAGKGTTSGRVTLFGYRAANPQGGADATGDTSGGTVKLTADIYSSLADAGFKVNPVVKAKYAELLAEKVEKPNGYGGTTLSAKYGNDVDLYNAMFSEDASAVHTELAKSYGSYDDAAIVVLSAGTSSYTGEDAKRTHKLQLDAEQYSLVAEAKEHFDKVIVLINDSTPLELGQLQADDGVDAIVIVGQPGDNGFDAVGKILNGEVNPSGHLADTYATDFTKDPSYNNVNVTGDTGEGNPRYWVDKNGNGTKDDDEDYTDSYFCDYDEGIYVGYRYWETAHAESLVSNYANFVYDDVVTYPFGYGLSYTNFSWQLISSSASSDFKVGDSLNFYVKVTNDGEVAGKDVVQLYYLAPYTQYDKTNKVEKSAVVLGDFAKTSLLQPGESEIVRLEVDVNDLASYDYTLAKTYILDEGNYDFTFRTDSHNIKEDMSTVTYNLAEFTKVSTAKTGATISNAFEDVSTTAAEHGVGTFSRSDFTGTFPQAETDAEKKLTQAQYDALAYDVSDKETDPWYTATMPDYMTAEERAAKPVADVKLADLVGVDYDDEKWDSLLDELTLDEMSDLITNAGFRTQAIDYIGKPYSLDTDGPKGWTGTGTAGTKYNAFAAEPVIAATFSKELAYEMGKIVGDQGIWGCSDRTDTDVGGKVYGYTGWYAPGMNMHRSPFEGRITEYFSEDPVLTGQLVANQSLGIKSKGGFVFIKHFAVHEDGGGVGISITSSGYAISGYRGTADAHSATCYWLTEQALREFYLKPFQISVEDGEAGACMSSFSRIGYTWAGGDYSLLTTLLRDEWGFKGYVVTDIAIYGFLNVDQMIRAGGDCLLTSSINSTGSQVGLAKWSSDGSNALTKPTQVAAMRKACKNILYTVANSHAMDVPMGAKVTAPTSELTSGKVGTAYSATFASEVNTKYAYSTVSYAMTGDIPAGLTFDTATGVLSGTPTKAGKYQVTVTASADGYESASETFTIVIDEAKSIADLEAELAELKSSQTADEAKIKALEDEIAALKDASSKSSGGCGGSIIAATSSIAAIALLGVALALKKKKED